MKSIDFTQPGGFPLTQDQLGYLQQAYNESTSALAAMGGDGSIPYKISGMDVTNPSTGSYTATDGWFFYNNEMIRFAGLSVSGASGGFAAYVSITVTALPLVYNDGSAPNVVIDKVGTLQVLPVGTPTDATHFPLSALQRFGVGFGVANRESSWQSLTVSTIVAQGGVSGTIYFKKDYTANTLHLRGSLTAANAQNFTAMPASGFYLMGTLPAGYQPVTNAYFTGQYFVASSVLDDSGVSWIKQVNCVLNLSGQIIVNWIKPAVSVSGYGINFSTIISLD